MAIPLRALIVEDSEDDAFLMERELRSGGYDVAFERVDTAKAMTEALNNRQWDFVLCDYTMPHFSGIDALRLLRGRDSDIPFIFVSGTIGEDTAVSAMKEGANDYVLKGNLKRLVPAIERELRDTEVRRARRQAEEQLHASYQTLTVLNKILLASLQSVPLESLLDMVIDYIISIPWLSLETERGLFLAEDGALTLKTQRNLPQSVQTMCARVPFGRCLCGRAAVSGKIEFADSIDERHENRYEGILPHGHYCVPITSADGVLGVIVLYVKEGHLRDEREENFLNAIAGVLAEIIQRRQAEEDRKKEMEIWKHLLMIADATAHTTNIDLLVRQVIHCSQRILGGDAWLSYLWEKDRNAFIPCQAIGIPKWMVATFLTEPLKKDTDFVKKTLETERPVIETAPLGAQFPWFQEINTIVAAPFIGQTEPLGLIVGIYKGAMKITEREEQLLAGISQQVSVALEEAKLYKEAIVKNIEISRKMEIIKTMHEIDRSILSTLASGEILEIATRMIGMTIPCDMATVFIADQEKRGFTYAAGFGMASIQKGEFIPFGDTTAAKVVETGRSQYIPNLGEVKVNLLPLEMKLLKEGFLSHTRLHLAVQGEEVITGVLTVGSKRLSAFLPADLSTLQYLASQIGVAMKNARLFSDIEGLFIGIVRSLSAAIDAKSPWTTGHSERVTGYAMDIAKEIGLSEKERKYLEIAGRLHDIGKLGTYEAILEKPDRLTPGEIAMIREHPRKGAEILRPVKQLQNIIPAVRHHHEYYDGSGYPDGLKGEDIPFMARILAVADTVDAMGSDRPYRKKKSNDAIAAELKRYSGIQFDPKIANAFLKIFRA